MYIWTKEPHRRAILYQMGAKQQHQTDNGIRQGSGAVLETFDNRVTKFGKST